MILCSADEPYDRSPVKRAADRSILLTMKPRILALASLSVLALTTLADAALSASDEYLVRTDAATGAYTKREADLKKRHRRLSEQLSTAARAAEEIGWDIYRAEGLLDVASYVVAEQLDRDHRDFIKGAILSRENGWRARFYTVNIDGTYAALVDVEFARRDAQPKFVGLDEVQPLSDTELAMIRAQELVKENVVPVCEGEFATITLPSDAGFSVYILRLSFEPNAIPTEGHMCYSVDGSGKEILDVRDFSRRCQMLRRTIDPKNPGKAESITSTADTPTELHTYLSLRYSVPFTIATLRTNLYWDVRDGLVTAAD